MTRQEKVLYHQIHPLKLAVDWATGLIALYPFWLHRLWLALVIAFVPSLIVSLALVRSANLEPYKASRFGRYISRYMTGPMQGLRLAGYVAMAIGAWFHMWWILPICLCVVVLAWCRGILIPQGPRASEH